MKIKLTFLFVLLFLSSLVGYSQKAEGLAQTPPMGWNSWNTFSVDISEDVVTGVVDKMIELGLKDAGYTYIVIDDGWMLRERDANGNLVPDPEKFPNGMKHLADYIHAKGFKFGIYNCAGSYTCGGYPGGRGHEYQDARLYASWGVDFLKYDWCSHGNLTSDAAYTTMRDALAATGRPILFSICEWGDTDPWNWAEEIGHMWRISGDIYPCFDCEDRHDDGLPTQWSAWGVTKILDMRDNELLRQHAKRGAWNDYDMLEVGNGMTQGEDRAHFVMWSMLSSPLMLGNDVRKVKKETLELLKNKEIIAVNQDTLGLQAFQLQTKIDLKKVIQPANDSLDVWVKQLAGGKCAVAFLNRSKTVINASVQMPTVKDNSAIVFDASNVYNVRNAIDHKDLGKAKKGKISISVPGHDILLYVFEPNQKKKK
ncbi:MAG: glycoside hydrolase family 27 protein [Bacteroidales bacterium]|nr:glycoside hydrolase family 27 protein [Bacteroidales bacterium]